VKGGSGTVRTALFLFGRSIHKRMGVGSEIA